MTKNNTKKMATVALLAAVIVVLQLMASSIRIGPHTISLSLIPIVVGAIVCGPLAGCFLGAVSATIITIASVTGADQGGLLMVQYNPVACIAMIYLKTSLAGLISGWVYKLIAQKNEMVAVFVASILVPLINTGIFTLGVLTIFRPLVEGWAAAAGASSVIYYVFIIMIGMNFVLEVAINAVLAPVVARVLKSVGKM
ncbi:MAG: ECF transporter S component [Erysipelotrichaceae bacterium]|nr:ECF transporter S component [Erysipelotrichaceae bacterium]